MVLISPDVGERAELFRRFGELFVEAASGIPYANGINVSPDGGTLYVGSTTGGSVHVFGIDPTSGALEERGEIAVGSGVDNIEIDEAGEVLIGWSFFQDQPEHAAGVEFEPCGYL